MSMSRIFFFKKKRNEHKKSARVARVKFKIANLGLFLLTILLIIIIIILDIWMRENDSFFLYTEDSLAGALQNERDKR